MRLSASIARPDPRLQRHVHAKTAGHGPKGSATVADADVVEMVAVPRAEAASVTEDAVAKRLAAMAIAVERLVGHGQAAEAVRAVFHRRAQALNRPCRS